MVLSLQEAAGRLGMSPRQLRYRIKEGTIAASKVGDRWTLNEGDLPGPKAESSGRAEALQAAVAGALAPHIRTSKRYSVQDLSAFQGALACFEATKTLLGDSHAATCALVQTCVAISKGVHAFGGREKVQHFQHARDCAAEAVALLAMGGAHAEVALVEDRVLPALSGLLRRAEPRPR